MKRILSIILLAAVCCAAGAAGNHQPIGTSLALLGDDVTPERLAEIKKAGIDYVEVVCNPLWKKVPDDEVYIRAYNLRRMVEEAGLTVWSCHLPFGRGLDIASTDSELRRSSVEKQEEYIRLCSIFHPKRIVVHPGLDNLPEPDSLRAAHLKCSKNSIGRLALTADAIGAVLCVENLPRRCPGRTSAEMFYLIGDFPNVKWCFDMNHLLLESHEEFIAKLGHKLGTVHMSDYDKIDEKHWLPGQKGGIIDWPWINRQLKKLGYDGVLMFEVNGKYATPEILVETFKNVIDK